MVRRSVEGCDLATGILIRGDDAELAQAGRPIATELERLQTELDEGPGLEACRSSSIVSSHDLSTDARWPTFRQHARRCGMASVAAIPLVPGRDSPSWRGWVSLYSHRAGPFPPASTALAETLVLYFSNTVNSALHARNLEAALESRDVIGQAKGILMARRNIDPDQAFAILQQASQQTNRRLRDVALAVVESCGHQAGRGPGTRS